MGVFSLSNGHEFVVKGHEGEFYRAMISRNVVSKDKEIFLKEMFSLFSEEDLTEDLIVEYVDCGRSDELYRDVYVIAENLDYKELPVVSDYNFHVSEKGNNNSHKVQLDFNINGWEKRLFVNFNTSVNGDLNFFSILNSFEDWIEDMVENSDLESFGLTPVLDSDSDSELKVSVYNKLGDFKEIYLTYGELKDSLVSMKLVFFKDLT